MGKNPYVMTEVSESEDDDDDDPRVDWNTIRSFADDKQKAIPFFDWLKNIFTPFTHIVIGCDEMNPVPCFILAQLAPGWVGGVLTSLALT